MLSFKEYTSLSFQNLFEQRFKNHFLKYAGKEIIYKYRLSYPFLESLSIRITGTTSVNYKDAISFFRDLIDKDKIFTNFYNDFIISLNPPLTNEQTPRYYQFLASFLQDQNFPVGITPRNSSFNQFQNADIALKDLFSYYLYKQMVILSGKKDDQSDSGSSKIDKIKEEMVKTFVPDSIVRNSFKTNNVSSNLLSHTVLNENTDSLINSISLSGLKTYEEPEGGQSPFNNQIVYDYTFPEFSFIYNNHTISFKKNIYNTKEINDRIQSITSVYQPAWQIFSDVSGLLETTKFIKYTDLFENNGAYVEFFFKFDYDKLQEFDGSFWFDGYNDESGTKVNWWEWNNLYKKEYYSFREIVFLFSALDFRYGPAGVQEKYKKDINIEIIKELNLRFGARLIVSSPTLKEDMRIQDNPQRQITENPYPIFKNKTFLYEFVSEAVKNKENNIDYYSYNNDNERLLQKIPSSGYPIGEYEVSATDELTQIYNIVKEQTNYKFIDVFVVDEKIIGKYYDQVLNNLFKQQTVVNYCISNFNDGSLDIATQNDDLYLEAIADQNQFTNNNTLITEAKKIDDNIDKNLITVIDSIEVV